MTTAVPRERALSAWVVRTAREFATDPAVRHRSAIAAGTGDTRAVHRAQVRRWESGQTPITGAIVRRYEQVLRLQDHHLACLIDQAHRASGRPVPVPVPTDPAQVVDRLLPIAERARDGEPMSGSDWYELAALLEQMPHVVIFDDQWAGLIGRCLAEMETSMGLEYDLRTEAATRLVGHRRSRTVIPRLVASVLADPTRQVYAEAACLLQFSNDPAAVTTLAGQLRRPTNAMTWRWSATALLPLVRSGLVQPELVREVVGRGIEVLRDDTLPAPTRLAAAGFLHATGSGRAVAGRLRTLAGSDLERVLLTGHSRPRESMDALSRRVIERADDVRDGGASGAGQDLMGGFVRRIDSIEAHSLGHAFSMMRLSPYAPAISAVFLDDVEDAVRRGDIAAAKVALTTAPSLTSAAVAERLARLITAPDTPGRVVRAGRRCARQHHRPALGRG